MKHGTKSTIIGAVIAALILNFFIAVFLDNPLGKFLMRSAVQMTERRATAETLIEWYEDNYDNYFLVDEYVKAVREKHGGMIAEYVDKALRARMVEYVKAWREEQKLNLIKRMP